MLQQDLKLCECFFTGPFISIVLDRLKELVVEETKMVHRAVTAVVAAAVRCKLPVKGFTWAIAAVVVGERISF